MNKRENNRLLVMQPTGLEPYDIKNSINRLFIVNGGHRRSLN
jgi:hypothetical protein